MDYQRVYREFIADRKSKPKPEGYTERHHILPRALGGGDEPENIIRLTAEDHYFAHCCLAKIYGHGMWTALCRMRWGRVHGEKLWITGRPFYAIARKRFAEENSRRCKGREGIKGAANWRYNHDIYRWQNLDTNEVKFATKWEMWNEYGGARAQWTAVVSRYRKSIHGWTTYPQDINIRGGKGKVFVFVNRDGRCFEGTQSQFAKCNGVSVASASRITRHQDVTKCGWRLGGVNDRQHWICRDGKMAWQVREEKKRAAKRCASL